MKLHSIVVGIVLAGITFVHAEMPIDQNLGVTSVGVSYSFELTGLTIDNGSASVAEMMHFGGMHYAPIPYFALGMKFGVSQANVQGIGGLDRGDFGFAGQGGLSLFTPEFAANVLQVTGGAFYRGCKSSFREKYLSTRTINGNLGLIIAPLPILDLELGGRYVMVTGESDLTQLSGLDIANTERVMGYAQLTLHGPESGAFLLIRTDLTPEISSDREGLYDGAVEVSIGTVLRHQNRSKFSRE